MVYKMIEYPLASIIVLTYEKFNHLNDNLESVFIQDYPNMELIISDDCSTNFPHELIYEKTMKKPSNIKNIKLRRNTSNLGIVKNYNAAICAASGEYIIPLSADDIFQSSDVVSSIIKAFLSKKYLIITGKRQGIIDDYSGIGEILPKKDDLEFLSKSPLTLFKKLCEGNFISGSCTSFSRKLFDKYGLFNETYHYLEDFPKYLSITRQGEQIGFIDKILIKYHAGGISYSKRNLVKLLDHIKTFENEIIPHRNFFSREEYNVLVSRYITLKKNYLIKDRKYFSFIIFLLKPRYCIASLRKILKHLLC